MPLLYFTLIACTLLLLAIWFMRPDWGIRSIFDLFVIVWAYYALCVPIDLALGLGAEGPFLLPDLNEQAHFEAVVTATVLYFSLAAGFILTYLCLPFAATSEARTAFATPFWWVRVPIRRIPPLWLILGGLLLALLAYVTSFDSIDRGEIGAHARANSAFLILTLVTSRLTAAAAIVLIVVLEDRRKARWIVVTGMMVSLLTGGRTTAVFILIAYLLRYEVVISRKARLAFLVAGFVFAAFLKIGYVYIASALVLGQPLSFADLVSSRVGAGLSLSRLEGIGGYAWTVYFLEQGPSPLWLGWSYVDIAARNTLPNFLTGTGVPTLALTYAPEVNPNFRLDPVGLAFSAVAEAWLNFGWIGPALIGAVWGAVAKVFDSGPRGIVYMLFALMSMRFLRSDFASAYNSNLVVMGVMVCLVYVLFLIWQHVAPRLRVGKA